MCPSPKAPSPPPAPEPLPPTPPAVSQGVAGKKQMSPQVAGENENASTTASNKHCLSSTYRPMPTYVYIKCHLTVVSIKTNSI